MQNEQVVFYCTDCRVCEKGSKRSVTGRLVKGALTGGLSYLGDIARALDSSSCSLCTHKGSEHKDKVTSPAFAFTPSGGNFDFGIDDGIGFRAVTCVQAASSQGISEVRVSPPDVVSMAFLSDRIEFSEVLGGGRLGSVAYESLVALEVGGPGVQSRGGGFAGGGFGLAGFAVGAVTAGVLNKLTTRTTIQTLMRVQVSTNAILSEWIFLTDIASPESVAGILRPITLQLELRAHQVAETANTATNAIGTVSDKVARLKELSDLHESGVLSEDEFNQLKRELLG